MNWIPHPVVLVGNLVSLVPLSSLHFDELISLAKDQRIWKHYLVDASDGDKMKTSLDTALKERDKGTQYPLFCFASILKI